MRAAMSAFEGSKRISDGVLATSASDERFRDGDVFRRVLDASAVSRASQALILANAGNPPQCGGCTRSKKPLSLDSSALPVSIFCGDPKFPPSQHAGAVPPGSLSVPAQEHFGFRALHVVPVGECVFARC
jgi:hypothetical protein